MLCLNPPPFSIRFQYRASVCSIRGKAFHSCGGSHTLTYSILTLEIQFWLAVLSMPCHAMPIACCWCYAAVIGKTRQGRDQHKYNPDPVGVRLGPSTVLVGLSESVSQSTPGASVNLRPPINHHPQLTRIAYLVAWLCRCQPIKYIPFIITDMYSFVLIYAQDTVSSVIYKFRQL